jgi:hypothetical protein
LNSPFPSPAPAAYTHAEVTAGGHPPC